MSNSESSTKVCPKCQESKHTSKFSKQKTTKDGLFPQCKSCDKIRHDTYYKTKAGLFSKIYTSQRCKSKKRGHNAPNYSKKELVDWIKSQPNFQKLWDAYVKSGYNKNLKPSLDRTNDYLPYSFSNLNPIITWEQHQKKSINDIKSGSNRKYLKPVRATNIETGDIFEFYSAAEAERQLGAIAGHISDCCKNKPLKKGFKKDGSIKYSTPKSAGGYTWEYID